VESAGGRVVVVEGADEAFKVTRPIDLLLAEALVDHRAASGRTR
jgi:2-C-methyl-D-erythritol 4-phosphate cytidylyltransferase